MIHLSVLVWLGRNRMGGPLWTVLGIRRGMR